MQGSWTRATLLAVMQDHIRRVMGHWKGQIPSWDVVNEAFDADGTLRDCVWRRVIGPDWVEQAFRAARAADPTAKLYLNEFGADTPNAASSPRRRSRATSRRAACRSTGSVCSTTPTGASRSST